jgi:hypothetical protein
MTGDPSAQMSFLADPAMASGVLDCKKGLASLIMAHRHTLLDAAKTRS